MNGQAMPPRNATKRYLRLVEMPAPRGGDYTREAIRSRVDFAEKFLPDRVAQVCRLRFLSLAQRRLLNQIQGRTYINMVSLLEQSLGVALLDLEPDHWLRNQTARAAVRFGDEQVSHRELFAKIERLLAEGMPTGYRFLPRVDKVAARMRGKSTWAALALICHIEACAQAHCRRAAPSEHLAGLYGDLLLLRWKQESQHAIVDELRWIAEDAKLSDRARERALDDFVALVTLLHEALAIQADADARYFADICGSWLAPSELAEVGDAVCGAYRWQYIVSGIDEQRFAAVLRTMISENQGERIQGVLASIAH
jgi:hypothetical protein